MSEEILNEAVAEAPLSQDYHDYLNEDGQIVAGHGLEDLALGL